MKKYITLVIGLLFEYLSVDFEIFPTRPICEACGSRKARQGYAAPMKPRRYKCLNCANKEKTGEL